MWKRDESVRPMSSQATAAPLPVTPVVQPTTPAPAPPAATTAPVPTPRKGKIFLSYRRADTADVGRILDHLQRAFGEENVFRDIDAMPLGVDFRKHLGHKVDTCDVVIVVIGPHWHNEKSRLDDPTDFVRIEIEAALRRDVPVVPVMVRGAKLPNETELPEPLAPLAYRHGMAVREDDPDFRNDVDRLIKGMREHLPKG